MERAWSPWPGCPDRRLLLLPCRLAPAIASGSFPGSLFCWPVGRCRGTDSACYPKPGFLAVAPAPSIAPANSPSRGQDGKTPPLLLQRLVRPVVRADCHRDVVAVQFIRPNAYLDGKAKFTCPHSLLVGSQRVRQLLDVTPTPSSPALHVRVWHCLLTRCAPAPKSPAEPMCPEQDLACFAYTMQPAVGFHQPLQATSLQRLQLNCVDARSARGPSHGTHGTFACPGRGTRSMRPSIDERMRAGPEQHASKKATQAPGARAQRRPPRTGRNPPRHMPSLHHRLYLRHLWAPCNSKSWGGSGLADSQMLLAPLFTLGRALSLMQILHDLADFVPLYGKKSSRESTALAARLACRTLKRGFAVPMLRHRAPREKFLGMGIAHVALHLCMESSSLKVHNSSTLQYRPRDFSSARLALPMSAGSIAARCREPARRAIGPSCFSHPRLRELLTWAIG